METPETIRTSPQAGEWGNLRRLQGCVLPHTNKQPVQEVHVFSYPGRDLSVQSTTLWSFHNPYGVYNGGQGDKTTSNETGYKDPPVPRRLVGQSQVPPKLSPTHTDLSSSLSRFGLASERGKIRAGTKINFQFRRLPVRLERGQGQTHTRTLANPTDKNTGNHTMTATEKQVHLGRLHMRPTQCHLKNNWRVPETLEKTIPIPKSLHPHLEWWLEESNVITGQPLHPLKHALQIFTDVSKEGWSAHLNEHMARGNWSVPERKKCT